MPDPSQFNIQRQPGPKHISIFNEDTGEEIGRFEGLTWLSVVDGDSGAPKTGDIQVSWNAGTSSLRGPLKKIAKVTGYKGAMSDVQAQRIKQLEAMVQHEYDISRQRLEQLVLHEQRLTAILRMLGGAVTIDDLEIAEAGNYAIEESYDPKTGTCLTLVERA